MLTKARDQARYKGSNGISPQELENAVKAIDRFEANNEAMVRARAANAVYNPSKDAECTTNLSNDVVAMNKTLGLPSGAFNPNDFVNEDTGFRAALYKSESNGKYILAFAGTDAHSLSDWQANIDNGHGDDNAQYIAARSLAKKLKEHGIDVDMTGHSKGGGLASDAGLIDKKAKVWTFNSAGLPVDSKNRPESTTSSVAELETRTEAFHTDGDFLTALQEEKDPAKQIANAEHLKSMLKGDAPSGFIKPLKITQMNPANTHKDDLEKESQKFYLQMDNLLKQAKEDDKTGKKIDLFPKAIGKPHVLGKGYTTGWLGKDLSSLQRHTMDEVFGDLEKEKNADQKTIKSFMIAVGLQDKNDRFNDVLKSFMSNK